MKRKKSKKAIKAKARKINDFHKESVVIEIDIRPATAKLKELQKAADKLAKTITQFAPK